MMEAGQEKDFLLLDPENGCRTSKIKKKKKEKEKGKVRDGQERNDVSQNWP